MPLSATTAPNAGSDIVQAAAASRRGSTQRQTANMRLPNIEACLGCGAPFPCRDGPIHPYMESSSAYWAAYGEALARECSDPTPVATHRLSVDAYAVQHPGGSSRQSNQSVVVHLIGPFAVTSSAVANLLLSESTDEPDRAPRDRPARRRDRPTTGKSWPIARRAARYELSNPRQCRGFLDFTMTKGCLPYLSMGQLPVPHHRS